MTDLRSVDIAPLFASAPPQQTRTDAEIWEALLDTGGFVVSGYPNASKIDSWAQMALSFFDAPDAVKQETGTRFVTPGNANLYRGYHSNLDGGWAHNEFYDIGPDQPQSGPDIPGIAMLTEPTPWPRSAPRDGWSDAVKAYYHQLNDIAFAVMKSIGRSAGFSQDAILSRFQGENSTLRLINYPTPPQGFKAELSKQITFDEDEPALAAGSHTDHSALSLLWQAQPGLQAQSPDGAWHSVPMIENCVSVHVGNIMHTLTDGAVRPTPHRVLDMRQDRRSIGFFLEPDLSAELAPAHEIEQTGDVSKTYG